MKTIKQLLTLPLIMLLGTTSGVLRSISNGYSRLCSRLIKGMDVWVRGKEWYDFQEDNLPNVGYRIEALITDSVGVNQIVQLSVEEDNFYIIENGKRTPYKLAYNCDLIRWRYL